MREYNVHDNLPKWYTCDEYSKILPKRLRQVLAGRN